MIAQKNSGYSIYVVNPLFIVLLFAVVCFASNWKNEEAIKEVMAGKCDKADVSWWGFDEEDSTDYFQEAINSGVKTLVVPNMGKDWVLRSVFLTGNQEIIFDDGVIVTAKKGEFHGRNDCLFTAENKENIILRGKALLRMQKKDYMSSEYEKAEWRHVLSFLGCTNVKVFDLTCSDSGGDGIYLGRSSWRSEEKIDFCKDILIQNVTCDNNYRQGISVISAINLVIEDCKFINTSGTRPAAGIDLEPDKPSDLLQNVTVRRCISVDNEGPGFMAYLLPLSPDSKPVSVRFEDCEVVSGRGIGLGVGGVKDGVRGKIEFVNCEVKDCNQSGVYIWDKSSSGVSVIFNNCEFKNTAKDDFDFSNAAENEKNTTVSQNKPISSPLLIYLGRDFITQHHGGVEFNKCTVQDDKDRPFLIAKEKQSLHGLFDVKADLTIRNPNKPYFDLGPNIQNVQLDIFWVPSKVSQSN